MEVKRFETKPTVFVITDGSLGVAVTTSEHMRNENRPLKAVLQEICEQANEYAKQIFHKFDYPDGEWYPCGSADVVLTWNEHREIINLFRKEASEKDDPFWKGWFGKLHKTRTLGWWWFPELELGSQAMRYEEEVCRFIRDKLALANIRVNVRTYID